MSLVLAMILGFVQALTEFLPVSSSGHLVVFQHFLEPFFAAEPTPLAFNVFVHLATLIVVLLYLRKDIVEIILGLFVSDRRERSLLLIGLVVCGSVPVGVIGLGFGNFLKEAFGLLEMAGVGFLITTVFLEMAHRRQREEQVEENDGEGTSPLNWQFPTFKQAVLIGFAQALAILPGVSRSGSTIATALLVGMKSEGAIRFSLLLSIPAILGATILQAQNIIGFSSGDTKAYLGAFLVASIFGWLALKLLVRAVKRLELRYFGFYTLALGFGVLLASLLNI